MNEVNIIVKLRQTILNQYEKCGYLCKTEWGTPSDPIDRGNSAPTNKYSAAGIAFHNAMDYWGKERIAERDVTLLSLHDKLDEQFKLIEPTLFKDANDAKTFYDSLHEQVNWTYEQSYLIKPMASEMPFNIDNLIGGIEATFTGTIDRIDGSFSNKDIDIVDYKSGKVYTKNELASNIQATIYCLAFKHLYGFLPKRFIFMFTKYRKTKVIQVTDEFLRAGTSRVTGIWMHMLNNEFEPNPKNKHFCKNFCTAYKECPCGKKQGWAGVGYEMFIPNA